MPLNIGGPWIKAPSPKGNLFSAISSSSKIDLGPYLIKFQEPCWRYQLLVLKWLKSQEGGLNWLVKNLGYLCKLKTTFNWIK